MTQTGLLSGHAALEKVDPHPEYALTPDWLQETYGGHAGTECGACIDLDQYGNEIAHVDLEVYLNEMSSGGPIQQAAGHTVGYVCKHLGMGFPSKLSFKWTIEGGKKIVLPKALTDALLARQDGGVQDAAGSAEAKELALKIGGNGHLITMQLGWAQEGAMDGFVDCVAAGIITAEAMLQCSFPNSIFVHTAATNGKAVAFQNRVATAGAVCKIRQIPLADAAKILGYNPDWLLHYTCYPADQDAVAGWVNSVRNNLGHPFGTGAKEGGGAYAKLDNGKLVFAG